MASKAITVSLGVGKNNKVKTVPFSVYAWIEPKTGLFRYIGQTNNIARRTIEHLSLRGDNVLFNKFIIDCLAVGDIPTVVVLETCRTREQAIKRERRYVAMHEDTVYNLQ